MPGQTLSSKAVKSVAEGARGFTRLHLFFRMMSTNTCWGQVTSDIMPVYRTDLTRSQGHSAVRCY